MNVKVRSLKVYGSFDDKPVIMLKGKWLERQNFNIHDTISVILKKDKIVITKIKEPKNNF